MKTLTEYKEKQMIDLEFAKEYESLKPEIDAIRIDIESHTASKAKPNKETASAMLEAERIARDPSVKGYSSVEELFQSLEE